MPFTTLSSLKKFLKCGDCKKKKAKILMNQLSDDNILKPDIDTIALCVQCFKKFMPHYTLEMKCIDCLDCFKCNLQKIIFTKKEIKQFKITLL